MSPLSGFSASHGLATALNRLGARVERSAADLSSGEALNSTEFAAAITNIQQAQLQFKAAALVMHTVNDLAAELLSKPRR
jgi:hypothetical protein